MSVRLRLALWNVAVIALALLGLGGLLRARVQSDLVAGVDRELLNRARFVRQIPPPPRRVWRLSSGPARLLTPNQSPPFFDPDGRNLITGAHALDRQAVRRSFQQEAPVLTTVGGVRVLTVGSGSGTDRIAFQTSESLAPVRQQLAQLTRTLWALLPLALGVAALGGLFLTDRALRPVRAVTEAAARIGAADLSRRLPVRGRDEFAGLAATVNGMLARLEDAFGRQRRFVADASHELKTPLTVIRANSSLALSDPELPEEVREPLVDIDRAAARTIRLVQDLLLLARDDAGALPLEREEVPVAELFETVAREARALHPQGAALDAVVEVERARGDRIYLAQLLLNLADNALRHTPADGRVTLRAVPEDGQVRLSVADTGPGIAPEHLPHLAQRFYRADSSRSRKEGGTGLGLAICQSIARAHGGTLAIESAPGQGTRVHLRLPAEAHDAPTSSGKRSR